MFTTIKKEQLIASLKGWKMVPLNSKDEDTIVAYIGGEIPIRIKGSRLTQDEFDKLYPSF